MIVFFSLIKVELRQDLPFLFLSTFIWKWPACLNECLLELSIHKTDQGFCAWDHVRHDYSFDLCGVNTEVVSSGHAERVVKTCMCEFTQRTRLIKTYSVCPADRK